RKARRGSPRGGNEMLSKTSYASAYEKEYCVAPEECLRPDVLVLGSAVGLYATKYLAGISPKLRPRIVVADAGGMDLLTHVSNMDVPRFPLLKEGAAHFGGKLCLWGTSAPRPPVQFLSRFPYPIEDLDQRFASVEAEIGG